jgi:molybdate/tungstate transport system substrate-binding protein
MRHIFLLPFIILLLYSCGSNESVKTKKITVFHAGSLSVPFRELKSVYEKKFPDIKILLEPAGSLVCARKITELKKPCDIIASADYFVINKMIIPEYSDWSIRFATNEMVIAFHEESTSSTEINSDNWIDFLLKDDVIFARSDPNSDPGGYRAVLLFLLAERYYQKEGVTNKLVAKNQNYIRPKEVDLLALLESNTIDYMFIYKSVAIQHKLKYIELPSEINLSDPSKQEIYQSVFINVTGKKPGTKMRILGDFINYSLTVLDKAPQKDAAIDFISFVLSKEGMDILRKSGQDPLDPLLIEHAGNVPARLLKYLSEAKLN